ncbi:MAG: DNA polymerase III subunit delta' [Acutalibacteraceae bacterium]|nr:DNA polymerase III subunit delta' [Acutalibacteraceae bacterium]
MSFPLVGNGRIRDAVTSAVTEKRIPHAILLEGDKGTGRHTLMRFLSRAAVCEGENPPCGVCRGCHLAQIGTHPDITVIAPEDGKKNITVPQIRALRTEAYVKPHMADRRVFVIDKADSMNEQAQNALLKVLEEPPADIIFILIAESAAALLDTIISRCTVLSLVPPETDEALGYLRKNTEFSEEQIREALGVAGNNIGTALDALSGGGTAAQAAATRFAEALISGDEADMLKITAEFEKNRVLADEFLKELKLSLATEIKKKLRSPHSAKALVSFYDALPQFEDALKTNINLSLLFCALVCKAAEITHNL